MSMEYKVSTPTLLDDKAGANTMEFETEFAIDKDSDFNPNIGIYSDIKKAKLNRVLSHSDLPKLHSEADPNTPKESLQCCTPSTSDCRKTGLKQKFNSVVWCDIDNPTDEVRDTIFTELADKVLFMNYTASRGLHIHVRCIGGTHVENWNAICGYILKHYPELSLYRDGIKLNLLDAKAGYKVNSVSYINHCNPDEMRYNQSGTLIIDDKFRKENTLFDIRTEYQRLKDAAKGTKIKAKTSTPTEYAVFSTLPALFLKYGGDTPDSRDMQMNAIARDALFAGMAVDEVRQFLVDKWNGDNKSGDIITLATIDKCITSAQRYVDEQNAKKEALQESPEYYRIGGIYYRASEDGSLQKWKKSEIMQDKGKYWIQYVKVLDGGFINEPSNTDYQQIIGNQYNIYHRPPTHTKSKEEFPTIMAMLEHLCKLSWKVEYLLDYIQICWQNPKQKLPVLVLTSRQQQTGKSSFFNFLQWMFGNTYVGSIEDITGQFTSGWAHSLFICLEESTTDRKAQNDRIKHLATAKTLKLEQKGVDAVQVDFNAKILLANNAEANPILLEDTDTRYSVLRIGELEQFNPKFEEDIKAELGAFIDFLSNRELSTTKQTRLWFSDEVIQTQHTLLAKDSAKPIAEVAFMEIVASIRSQYPEAEILFRLSELKSWFSYLGYDWKQECVVAVLKRTCKRVSRRAVTVYACDFGDEGVKPEIRSAPAYYWKVL